MLGLANIFRYQKSSLLFILASCILYMWFAYDIERTETSLLLSLYSLLFVLAYQLLKNHRETNDLNFKSLVVFSILFRLLLLFAVPNLSQDFYRFIWDGQMILSGLNPYLSTPDFQMEMGMISNFPNQVELHNGMGALSASHFTNYPAINQLCFVLGNLFPGNSILSSVIGMRLLIIAADLGTLFFGYKLLKRLNLPVNRIFWYLLNPFIIIELTGNLHFEGVMIFFLVWSLYLIHFGKWQWAAVVFACSVSVKLIPLMFLPLFFWWFLSGKKANKKIGFDKLRLTNEKTTLGLNKLVGFYGIIGLVTILLFLLFFSMEFINNYSQTVGLWFGDFEFNASIYYLARALGYTITGYNEIAIIGKILPMITLLIILGLSLIRKNDTFQKLLTAMLLALTCYLFLSTTVHPWYLATLVMLSVFTNYRFPLVWSFVVILSYVAYGNELYYENIWVVTLEYLIVFGVFVWEVILKRKLPVS